MDNTLETRVIAVVRRHARIPEGDGPLELDSLTLVAIAEDLEAELNLRVRPSELLPENFASIRAIVAYAAGKRQG